MPKNKEMMPPPLPFQPRPRAALSAGSTPSLSRRRFLRRLLATGSLGAAGLVYPVLWEPNHPQVERVTVPIVNLPPAFDGMRIAALSDLHVQPLFPASRLDPALRLVEQERPDMICLLGDYVNYQDTGKAAQMQACAQALSQLRAPLGVFASFGNHDFPIPPADPPRLLWQEAGMTPLADDVAEVSRGGERIFVAGLRSALQRPVAPQDTLGRVPWDATKIVLWHEPDSAALCAASGAHLMLSGHTHGGQVRVPGLGLRLPAGGRLFPSGLFHIGGPPGTTLKLYVTRGVGLLPPMVRINCPPEVTLLTLRRQEASA